MGIQVDSREAVMTQLSRAKVIGIDMLLFVVGLTLDMHLIHTVGPVALATGLGQVIVTPLMGFAIIGCA
jgi:Kef-type K+ transport system membrane component KefB